MPYVIVADTAVAMEITSKELEMIMAQREKEARIAKRDAYIAEINSLIERMNADGFTLGNKGAKSWKLHSAQPWGDTANSWIEIK